MLLVVGELVLRQAVPASGTTPFRSGTPGGLPYDLRPSFRTLYKGAMVTTNALGFRGAALPPSGRRVVLVGDSMTFGNTVADQGTLPFLLGRELQARGLDAHVVNAGVPGYNVADVDRMVCGRVLDLEPTLVVYVFFANDIMPSKPLQQVPPDAEIDMHAKFPLRSALLQAVGLTGREWLRAAGLAGPGGWAGGILDALDARGLVRLRQHLAHMQRACVEQDVELLVAAYPHLAAPGDDPLRAVDAAAGEVCAALGVPWLDLAEAFEPGEDLSALRSGLFDAHPTAEANARVARFLADAIAPRVGR